MFVPLSSETIYLSKIRQYVLIFCFRRKTMLVNLVRRAYTTSANSMVFPPRIQGPERYQRCAVCWEYVQRMPVSSAKSCNPLRQTRKGWTKNIQLSWQQSKEPWNSKWGKSCQKVWSVMSSKHKNFGNWNLDFWILEPCIYWWKSRWHMLLRLSHKLDSWGEMPSNSQG